LRTSPLREASAAFLLLQSSGAGNASGPQR